MTAPAARPRSPLDAATQPGLHWYESGQSALSGALLGYYRRLEAMFLRWAAELGAEEHLFPPFISARELSKIDYLRSFPHLATFAVALDQADPANLAHFVAGEPYAPETGVALTRTAPVHDVLTPAACYHLYVRFQGADFDRPRTFTTRNTCHRREKLYRPLERQWAFSMREIVCIGEAPEVGSFLERCRARVAGFFERVGLPVAWSHATDPFFDPSRNPKYIAQKLDPVKHEMVFDGGLAIGSVNFHRSYFGDAFRITRGGAEAFSGCVAFGIERWLFAFIATFGPDPAAWPRLDGEGEAA